MSCKYDPDREEYLNDGEPCRRDDYGDPTRHCTARRSCAQHVGPDELTCARCLGRTRTVVRRIVALSPLMAVQALGSGVDSEAAWLAAPAADVRGWSERRIAMRDHLDTWRLLGFPVGDQRHVLTEKQVLHARSMMEDDDERHPYTVLTRWQMMLSEDYGHEMPTRLTILGAGAYLDRTLGRMAQDPEQDFGLFAREARQCCNHLESVIRNSSTPERGAPCPECRDAGHVVRLSREYGHWCEDPDCERLHYADDSEDRWVCPRDRSHWRSHEDYQRWIEDRATPAASA